MARMCVKFDSEHCYIDWHLVSGSVVQIILTVVFI